MSELRVGQIAFGFVLGAFIVAMMLIESIIMADVCDRALDRSHDAADTATVYRLRVCHEPKKQ